MRTIMQIDYNGSMKVTFDDGYAITFSPNGAQSWRLCVDKPIPNPEQDLPKTVSDETQYPEYTPTEWPEGAQWWAVDENQWAYFYFNSEPTACTLWWVPSIRSERDFSYVSGTIKDWRTSKRKRPVKADDGWIEWTVSKVPSGGVEVKFRDGTTSGHLQAKDWDWNWNNTGEDGDIIAYRVIK